MKYQKSLDPYSYERASQTNEKTAYKEQYSNQFISDAIQIPKLCVIKKKNKRTTTKRDRDRKNVRKNSSNVI